MQTNRKENMIYTFIMCTYMAFLMTTYNVMLRNGVSLHSLKAAWSGFPLTLIVAFTLEWFLVGKYGMKIAFKLIKRGDSVITTNVKTALVIVPCMAILMSLYGTICSSGINGNLPKMWILNICRNIIVAFTLVLIGNPVIGHLFSRIFSKGTLL